MSGFHFAQDPTGGNGMVCFGLGTAAQTYTQGDPIMITADRIVTSPDNGNQVLLGQLHGFAFESALGSTAGSRAALGANFQRVSPTPQFGDVGSGADAPRSYIPVWNNPIMWTNNIWTAGAAGTQDPTGIASADLYRFLQISSDSAGDWGIELTNGVGGTDAVAQVLWVTDALGNPISAAGATAVGGQGDGVKVFFRISNIHELTGTVNQ